MNATTTSPDLIRLAREPAPPRGLVPSARLLVSLALAALFVLPLASAARAESPAPRSSPPAIDLRGLERKRPPSGDPGSTPATAPATTLTRAAPAAGMCLPPRGPWPDEEGVLLEGEPTPYERRVVERQIQRCMRSVELVADPWRVLALFRLEEQLAIPDEARGILGAIWCIESGMRTRASSGGPIRGDVTDGQPHAIGPLQGHAWLWQWCGLVPDAADDLFQAARCYWSRVSDRHAQLGAACGKHGWRVAEALTANGRKYLPMGCKAESGHWLELESWRIDELPAPEAR